MIRFIMWKKGRNKNQLELQEDLNKRRNKISRTI